MGRPTPSAFGQGRGLIRGNAVHNDSSTVVSPGESSFGQSVKARSAVEEVSCISAAEREPCLAFVGEILKI